LFVPGASLYVAGSYVCWYCSETSCNYVQLIAGIFFLVDSILYFFGIHQEAKCPYIVNWEDVRLLAESKDRSDLELDMAEDLGYDISQVSELEEFSVPPFDPFASSSHAGLPASTEVRTPIPATNFSIIEEHVLPTELPKFQPFQSGNIQSDSEPTTTTTTTTTATTTSTSKLDLDNSSIDETTHLTEDTLPNDDSDHEKLA